MAAALHRLSFWKIELKSKGLALCAPGKTLIRDPNAQLISAEDCLNAWIDSLSAAPDYVGPIQGGSHKYQLRGHQKVQLGQWNGSTAPVDFCSPPNGKTASVIYFSLQHGSDNGFNEAYPAAMVGAAVNQSIAAIAKSTPKRQQGASSGKNSSTPVAKLINTHQLRLCRSLMVFPGQQASVLLALEDISGNSTATPIRHSIEKFIRVFRSSAGNSIELEMTRMYNASTVKSSLRQFDLSEIEIGYKSSERSTRGAIIEKVTRSTLASTHSGTIMRALEAAVDEYVSNSRPGAIKVRTCRNRLEKKILHAIDVAPKSPSIVYYKLKLKAKSGKGTFTLNTRELSRHVDFVFEGNPSKADFISEASRIGEFL